MKRVLTLGITLLLVASMARAQSVEDVFGQIEAAIRSGDAAALSAHFNSTVEVTIGDKSQDYSKTQGQFVVKEFFQSYPVKSFSFAHRGNSGTTFYAVGSYVGGRGTYDANVFVKKYGAAYLIDQIRFERKD